LAPVKISVFVLQLVNISGEIADHSAPIIGLNGMGVDGVDRGKVWIGSVFGFSDSLVRLQ
jgi:hypothetical protein